MEYNLKTSNAYNTFIDLVAEQGERGGKTLRASTNRDGVTTLYTTSKISVHGLLERWNFKDAVNRKNTLHTQGLRSLKELAKQAYPQVSEDVLNEIFKEKEKNSSFKATDLSDLRNKLEKAKEESINAKELDRRIKENAVKTETHDLKKTVDYQRMVRQANQTVNKFHSESEIEQINAAKAKAQTALKNIEEQAPIRAQQAIQRIDEFKNSKPHNNAQQLKFNEDVDFYSVHGNPVGQLVKSLNQCHDKKDAGERAITIFSLAQVTASRMNVGGRPGSNLLVSSDELHPTMFWENSDSPGYGQKGTELGWHFKQFTYKLSPNDNYIASHFVFYFRTICEKYPDEVKAAAIMTGKKDLVEKLLDKKIDHASAQDTFTLIFKEQLKSLLDNKRHNETLHSPFISELMWQIANKAEGIKLPKDLNNP